MMSDTRERASFAELYRLVFESLTTGEIRPGERLGIKDLANKLSVSPTPMREILSRLVGRDIVEERRAEGYYLTSFDARQIADLYELHGCIVDLALRDQSVVRVIRLDHGPDTWSMLDSVVEATGNRALLETRRYLDERLKILRRCETFVFDDLAGEAEGLRALLDTKPDIARRPVKLFHQRRAHAARSLAFCLSRR